MPETGIRGSGCGHRGVGDAGAGASLANESSLRATDCHFVSVPDDVRAMVFDRACPVSLVTTSGIRRLPPA